MCFKAERVANSINAAGRLENCSRGGLGGLESSSSGVMEGYRVRKVKGKEGND